MKRGVALASATALVGLVIAGAAAGCSSSAGLPPATMTDARANADPPSRPRPAETGEPPFPSTCPYPGPFDTSDEPFKTPTPFQAGGCTTADLEAIEAAIEENAATTLDDVIKKTTASCQACAYGPATGATWAPFVSGVKAGTETGTIYNDGACMALASGADACGLAYAGWADCLRTACSECDTGAMPFCNSFAQQSGRACASQTTDLANACGLSVNDYLTACDDLSKVCTTCGGTNGAAKFYFELSVIAQCIQAPASADAGVAGDGG